MPELPEVETIRQDLRRKVMGHRFVKIVVVKEKAVRGSVFSLEDTLPKDSIKEIERVGKLLMFYLKSGLYMLVHLKMTGQLIYVKNNRITAGGHSFPALNTHLPDKHTQIIFTFDNGGVLYFNDMRRFGYVRLVSPEAKDAIVSLYGLEPLTSEFTYAKFKSVLEKRKTVLKALLLNQKYFAGIGNIYADEICHQAKVLPFRNTSTLKEADLKRLFAACNLIIKKAVKYRGTTFNNYVDSEGNKGNFVGFLKVYDRDGKQCKTCKKAVIQKKTVAGRGTCFCPNCQK